MKKQNKNKYTYIHHCISCFLSVCYFLTHAVIMIYLITAYQPIIQGCRCIGQAPLSRSLMKGESLAILSQLKDNIDK